MLNEGLMDDLTEEFGCLIDIDTVHRPNPPSGRDGAVMA
jgi:hypothetical protein